MVARAQRAGAEANAEGAGMSAKKKKQAAIDAFNRERIELALAYVDSGVLLFRCVELKRQAQRTLQTARRLVRLWKKEARHEVGER
jgi:hypothetical protein